jgi:sulfide:quinone oxidoreductase
LDKTAYFEYKDEQGNVQIKPVKYDFIHVVPPQEAPAFIKQSELSDNEGWLDVDQLTLQHKKYPNIFGLGDVINSPNAKTAAAARKQVYVVAVNLIAAKELRNLETKYDGYGACPLTVERGKVILAEFGFGGKLLPTFPLHPPVARRSSWFMKQLLMPWLYWNLMQKGIEWLAKPSRK